MDWSPIAKPRGALRREPCLTDYEQARRDFTWEQASRWLTGPPGGASTSRSRRSTGTRGSDADGVPSGSSRRDAPPQDLTYRELAGAAHRFANVLARLGVRAATASRPPRSRAGLYAAALGTLEAGAVFCPLFSAFGPEPIRARLALGGSACW